MKKKILNVLNKEYDITNIPVLENDRMVTRISPPKKITGFEVVDLIEEMQARVDGVDEQKKSIKMLSKLLDETD